MKPRGVVEISRRADRDLDEIHDYLSERNPDAAERFYRAARDAFETLLSAPKSGAARHSRNERLRGLRMRPVSGFESYVVYYAPTRAGIRVVRVLHGARNARRILKLA